MTNSNTYKAGRHFLQVPGPTNIPDRVLQAMAFPAMDHRGPDFQNLSNSILKKESKIRFIKRNLLNFVKETPLSIRITNYKFYHIYILIRCTEYE